MHQSLAFWGQNWFFWGGVQPLHHTPPFDAYGASALPYWNPKYTIAYKNYKTD